MVPGDRLIVVGKSGSGKTTLMLSLIAASPVEPIIICDTKGETAYERFFPMAVIVKNLTHLDKGEIIIWKPGPEIISDPEELDAQLGSVVTGAKNIMVVIDEGYMFHRQGQAFPTLIGLLTRGRSKGIVTLIGSQRPRWISRFCFSEATRGYFLKLTDPEDRKIVAGYAGVSEEDIPTKPFETLAVDLQYDAMPVAFRIDKPQPPKTGEVEANKKIQWV